MEINVNVKLSLDKGFERILKAALVPSLIKNLADGLPVREDESPKMEKPAAEPEGAPAPAEAVVPVSAPEVSDLPFDNDAEEKPLPFVAIWTAEDARKARKMKMDEIEESVAPGDRENIHKQMVKITKLYLQSAAYKHDRNEKGEAVNKDGLPVKRLDELDSDETLRFMYLCGSMFYLAEQNEVFPSKDLDDVVARCKDWEAVEREFVKTYQKK